MPREPATARERATTPAYTLAICEIFHPQLHGHDENSSPSINNEFLVYSQIDLSDFYNQSYLAEIRSLKRYVNAIQRLHGTLDTTHPAIRNYTAVTNKCIRLEIIQTNILAGQEEVAYLKTFWLRIVQRRWKKIYKMRKALIAQRSHIRSITERERTGQWPIHLRDWPYLT
jgi:hypothetical protein